MGSDWIAADPHLNHLRLGCHGKGHSRGFDYTAISANRRQADHGIRYPYQMRAQAPWQDHHMGHRIGPIVVDDDILALAQGIRYASPSRLEHPPGLYSVLPKDALQRRHVGSVRPASKNRFRIMARDGLSRDRLDAHPEHFSPATISVPLPTIWENEYSTQRMEQASAWVTCDHQSNPPLICGQRKSTSMAFAMRPVTETSFGMHILPAPDPVAWSISICARCQFPADNYT